MKETFFKYVYRSAIGVMVFSALLLTFVQNTAPFGLSASWSTEGLGSSLVITQPLVTASAGSEVVRSAELQNQVSLHTVQEVLRRDGTMYYQLANTSASESLTVPAIELGRTAIVSIPLLGAFVKALSYTVGVMALIGLPLLMLSINYAMVAFRKVLPTLSLLERGAKRTEERVRDVIVEEESEHEMTTVLQPYKFKRKLSLQ